MCLSVAVDRPDRVLASGEHAGHEWFVTHNGMGHRCGYVKVQAGHPWHGKAGDELNKAIEVHGGVTFAEPDKPCGKGGEDIGYWIGFDCAHWRDAPDPALPNERIWDPLPFADEVVRTQCYVEAECKFLCEQAKFQSESMKSEG